MADRQRRWKTGEMIKLIEGNGWYRARTKGDHRQFKHHNRPGLVTVSGKLSDVVPVGTLRSIWAQAGLNSADE